MIFPHIKYSCGLPFLGMFRDDGWDTLTYIQEPANKRLYDGMDCPKASSLDEWKRVMKPGDTVFFDYTGNGALGAQLRAARMNVFGGQVEADNLEADRFYGIDVMRKFGIDIPQTQYFHSRSEGIAFVRKAGGRWVYKPRTGIVSSDCYCASEESDLIDFIKKQPEQDYLLQEFVEGIELSTACFFSKGIPLSPAFHTLETKKLLAGDIGDNVGAQSAITWFTKDLDNLGVKLGIGRAFPWFKAVGFTGVCDLNTIVVFKDGKVKMLGLEWTPRNGYGCDFGLVQGMKISFGELVIMCASGRRGNIPVHEGVFCFDVRVSYPPYPLEANPKTKMAVEFLFEKSGGKEIKIKDSKYIAYPVDVLKKDGKLVTGGGDGIGLEVCGKTNDLESEEKNVVDWIKENIILKGAMFRCDPFTKMKHLPNLRIMGFDIP